MVYRSLISSFLFLLLCSMSYGCGMISKANRPTLNSLDRSVENNAITNSTPMRVVAFPAAFSAGLVAGSVDAFICIPAFSAHKSFCDTAAILWEKPEGSDFRQAMLLLPKSVTTPFFFAGDWLVTTLFQPDEIKPERGAICGK
jgi:hypothetical protein